MSNGDHRIKFEILAKDNINAFTDFFNQSRNRKINNSFFFKKYRCDLKNDNSFNLTIKKDGTIAGHLGVLEESFGTSNYTYKCGQISDAVLDVSLRGQGYFKELIHETENYAFNHGFEFLWVSPSPQAVNAFIDNNWLEFDKLVTFEMEISSTIPLYRIFHKVNLASIYRKYVNIRLQKFVPSASKRSAFYKEEKLSLKRDSKYIATKNYTFNKIIKINDFVMWIKFEDGLTIGNISNVMANNTNTLISTIEELAKKLGCHKARVVTTKNSALYSLLKGNLSLHEGNSLFYKTQDSTLDLKELSISGSDLNTF